MPRPGCFTPRKDPVPIVWDAGWALEPVWMGVENPALPTGIWSPDRPARSKSLYRLCYPAHYIIPMMPGNKMMISYKKKTHGLQSPKLLSNLNWPVFVHWLGRLSNNTRVVGFLAPVIIFKYGNDTCSDRKSDRTRWGVCHLLACNLLQIVRFTVCWLKLHFVLVVKGQNSRWKLENKQRPNIRCLNWNKHFSLTLFRCLLWKINNAVTLTKYLFWIMTHQPHIFQMANQTHQHKGAFTWVPQVDQRGWINQSEPCKQFLSTEVINGVDGWTSWRWPTFVRRWFTLGDSPQIIRVNKQVTTCSPV